MSTKLISQTATLKMNPQLIPHTVLILLTLSISTSGLPQPQSLGAALAGGVGAPVSVLKDERQPLDLKGNYKYDIELSDGTKLEQDGATEAPEPGETEGSLVVHGSYSYIAPDGSEVQVTYVADKNGFRPVSKQVPKSG